jgi:DNA-binding transcriptional regulator GbsR (MarR family)
MEQVKAKKVIAVYPGRFQPFGPHHRKVFQNLQKKFGDVYITTSNIKQPPRHPLNFKEKVRHMTKMGIPKNKIIFEKNPYVANSLLKRFDGDKVAVVYVFGAKDAGRLKGGKKKSGGLSYYQDFKKHKNNLMGYETHGYIYTAPHVKVSGITSGTEIRKLLGSSKMERSKREKLFKKTFGYFDKGVFNMLTNKFRKLTEIKKTIKKELDLSEEIQLIIEGGAYGHMAHPFDDNNLTFGDLKKIIKLGLSGQLNREDDVTEKTDGQNLMITYRDGKVLAARNKGQIKNRGQNALDVNAVAKQFSGRGDIRDAFVFAMKDLSKAINSLSDKQKDKVFKNGEIFMNLEIIYPASSNVIDYDKQILQFHNSLQYDKNGNAVGEVKGSGRMLQGMIKQVNQDIGKHFKIIKPKVLSLPKKIDFGKKVDIYYKRVNKLQSQFGLKDTDTLGLYHQSYWEEYIYNAGRQFGYKIPKTILKKLTQRWAFFDKSYKIPNIRKDLSRQPEFLNWVMNIDKKNHRNIVRKNMLPFEKIFFSVGADILENLSNFIAANPSKAVEKIRRDILKASNQVRAGGDIKKMKKLKQQLEKLNSLGGLNKIVPVEGVVFKYKGKTYKFTGAFAPVNQILGLVSY